MDGSLEIFRHLALVKLCQSREGDLDHFFNLWALREKTVVENTSGDRKCDVGKLSGYFRYKTQEPKKNPKAKLVSHEQRNRGIS